MSGSGLPGLERLFAGEPINEAPLAKLIAFIDARHDCADFRMVVVLSVWYRARELLSPSMQAEVRRAILQFAYRMEEPDTDAMCMWSENHQILFAACEYLAGQAFPDEQFGDSGYSGRERMAGAAQRLDRWLTDRFRFGFSEWTSTSYYEEDAAALGLLVEHCADERLAARATGVLDLLFLDLALHSFDGRLVTTSGRAYERLKKYPEHANVDQLLAWAFSEHRSQPTQFNYSGVIGPFLLSTRYQVPDAIRAIAADRSTLTLRTSSGLDVAEVAEHFPGDELTDAIQQLWAMEAFTMPASINHAVDGIEHYELHGNAFLHPLARLRRLRHTGLLPTLVRLAHPVTRGLSLQRANITTWRSAHAVLASVQRYHPGDFGSQQHLWTLGLPGDVAIFAVHPGAVTSADGGIGRSDWEGNGINPVIGQDDNLLLALYDTRGRPGLLEPLPRARRSQLFVPFNRLTEWHFEQDRLWVRSGSGCALILADGPILRFGDRLVRRGRTTGWAVLVAPEPITELPDFVARTRGFRLVHRDGRLDLRDGEEGRWTLTKRQFNSNGVEIDAEHPRFDTPWVLADRFADRLEINAGAHRLVLDQQGRRLEQ